MNKPILSDKNQSPTEEIISSHIGKSKIYWDSIFEYIHSNHPDFSQEWRYYNDGKSWLMKVRRKSKTIFWLSVIPNSFRITFYFGDKAKSEIMQCRISDKIKKQFNEGKKYGKIRALSLVMNTKKNVDYVKELILIKINLKT